MVANAASMQSSKTVQPAAVSTKNLGTWEKHTKGIGMKLLQKFGFTGRLGAREDGVSQAIEVVVRPNGQGLGFGDFKEQSTLTINKKLEAEWRGTEYVEEVEEKKEVPKKRKKNESEQVADSKSWKKKSKQSAVQMLDISDFMGQPVSSHTVKQQVVIDMRGQQTRVLTDLSDINAAPTDAEADSGQVLFVKPKLGQELLYNLNLVVELVEVEVTNDSRSLSQDTQRLTNALSDIDALEKQIVRDAPRLQRLRSILAVLEKVKDKQAVELVMKKSWTQEDHPRRESAQAIDLAAITSLFQTLHSSFREEFRMFGLLHLLPSIVTPILQRTFSDWKPMTDPLRIALIHTVGADLAAYFDACGERGLATETRLIVGPTAEKLTLPAIRRALTNDWDVRDPAHCVALLETLRDVFPLSVVEGLLDMFVQPKLAAAVKQWSPTSDPLPIHTWLHQWLPLMKAKLSTLYPDIRRKLHQALTHWEAKDESALAILRPWKDVFDRSSMENFVIKAIVPKLVVALRALVINPQDQDLALFNFILAWKDLVPRVHFTSLFTGEFFPRWLRVLVNWLSISPDFGEVSHWYSGWKSMFPTDLVEDADIVKALNTALDLMNMVVTADDDDECAEMLKRAGAAIGEASYFSVVEKRLAEVKMRGRLEELEGATKGPAVYASSARTTDVSFKDVVASFAMTSNVEFAPKQGRQYEGKQIWQFGQCTCYLDQDVVFVYETDIQRWRPTALEDLLTIA